MKKYLILLVFYSLIGQSETYEQYTKRINEISHTIQPRETIDKILIDRGYKNLDGPWGARKQTLLKNGMDSNISLVPGQKLILPYSPGEQETFKQRSIAQDRSYNFKEPLRVDAPAPAVKPKPLAKKIAKSEPEVTIEEIPLPEKKVKIKEVIKERIVYVNKSEVDYEDWSFFRIFLGHKFTKIALDDPTSGSASLDSQYHFEVGGRWTQKWDKNIFIYSQLDVDILTFDKPQGVSFNKSRFFLPGIEIGTQFNTENERLTFAFRYKSESQALTKVNDVLDLTSLETSSFIFGIEKVLEGKRNYKFIGEAQIGYVIPTSNNGVSIEDGYNIKVGGTIRYEKTDFRFDFKPYFNWSQKKTSLTDEDKKIFGIQFGYGKDF